MGEQKDGLMNGGEAWQCTRNCNVDGRVFGTKSLTVEPSLQPNHIENGDVQKAPGKSQDEVDSKLIECPPREQPESESEHDQLNK